MDPPECEQLYRTTCPRANYVFGEEAELREYDLTSMGALITEVVEIVCPLLTHRPPLRKMFGRMCYQKRNVGFFADPKDSYGYFYSEQVALSIPLPPPAMELLKAINAAFGLDFNGILVNEYETGTDYVSRHQDSDVGKDPPENVLAISYGAERKFRIRRNNKIIADAPTRHMHALLMTGSQFQKGLQHEIPQQSNVGRRVSLTFRTHDKAYEEEQMANLESNKRKRDEL
jgi:alkylated DNA repair dioxygenase AlkB